MQGWKNQSRNLRRLRAPVAGPVAPFCWEKKKARLAPPTSGDLGGLEKDKNVFAHLVNISEVLNETAAIKKKKHELKQLRAAQNCKPG